MKKYPHIISKLFYEPLVITREKHAAICRVLEARMGAPARVMGMEDDDDEDEELSAEAAAERIGYSEAGSTAIIRVEGPIGKHLSQMEMMSGGGCDLDNVGKAIDVALADDSIERILFDFRTPGGAVTGLPEMARKIASISSKETVAFTDSECCSGGLWLAAQCQKFYCAESARVGSIGVWCAYPDLSRKMAMEGESMQAFSAGKHKLLGAYWKPLSDDEKQIIQGRVDKIYQQFKEAVNTRREISDEHMQGQIFDGVEACQAGLCDGMVDDLSELLDE